MSETDRIALEPVVYENVVEYVKHNLPLLDKYNHRVTDIEEAFDSISEYTRSDVFVSYKEQMNSLNEMLRDYFDMVVKVYTKYCEIGETLKGLDETVYLTMTEKEKYYLRDTSMEINLWDTK